MFFDFDTEKKAAEAACPGVETRCYLVTGTAPVLRGLETLLRRVEWIGECGATRLVSAFVDGRRGAKVEVRVLAGWVKDSEGVIGDAEGAPLPRLADERDLYPHYMVDISREETESF